MSPALDICFLLLGLLPPSKIKNWLLSLHRGWSIDPTARISPCLISNVAKLSIGPRASIGTGTIVRNLARIELAEDAYLGRLNQVTSARTLYVPDDSAAGTLVLGEAAGTTYRHLLDCSGGLELGAFTVIGGSGTEILTHGVDLVTCLQTIGGVRIGHHSLVLSRCVILKDVQIGDKIILAAGSVATKSLDQSEYLYAGVPAKPVKAMPSDAGYFHRDAAWIGME